MPPKQCLHFSICACHRCAATVRNSLRPLQIDRKQCEEDPKKQKIYRDPKIGPEAANDKLRDGRLSQGGGRRAAPAAPPGCHIWAVLTLIFDGTPSLRLGEFAVTGSVIFLYLFPFRISSLDLLRDRHWLRFGTSGR